MLRALWRYILGLLENYVVGLLRIYIIFPYIENYDVRPMTYRIYNLYYTQRELFLEFSVDLYYAF